MSEVFVSVKPPPFVASTVSVAGPRQRPVPSPAIHREGISTAGIRKDPPSRCATKRSSKSAARPSEIPNQAAIAQRRSLRSPCRSPCRGFQQAPSASPPPVHPEMTKAFPPPVSVRLAKPIPIRVKSIESAVSVQRIIGQRKAAIFCRLNRIDRRPSQRPASSPAIDRLKV